MVHPELKHCLVLRLDQAGRREREVYQKKNNWLYLLLSISEFADMTSTIISNNDIYIYIIYTSTVRLNDIYKFNGNYRSLLLLYSRFHGILQLLLWKLSKEIEKPKK